MAATASKNGAVKKVGASARTTEMAQHTKRGQADTADKAIIPTAAKEKQVGKMPAPRRRARFGLSCGLSSQAEDQRPCSIARPIRSSTSLAVFRCLTPKRSSGPCQPPSDG